jgi:hypothetical protein
MFAYNQNLEALIKSDVPGDFKKKEITDDKKKNSIENYSLRIYFAALEF